MEVTTTGVSAPSLEDAGITEPVEEAATEFVTVPVCAEADKILLSVPVEAL